MVRQTDWRTNSKLCLVVHLKVWHFSEAGRQLGTVWANGYDISKLRSNEKKASFRPVACSAAWIWGSLMGIDLSFNIPHRSYARIAFVCNIAEGELPLLISLSLRDQRNWMTGGLAAQNRWPASWTGKRSYRLLRFLQSVINLFSNFLITNLWCTYCSRSAVCVRIITVERNDQLT